MPTRFHWVRAIPSQVITSRPTTSKGWAMPACLLRWWAECLVLDLPWWVDHQVSKCHRMVCSNSAWDLLEVVHKVDFKDSRWVVLEDHHQWARWDQDLVVLLVEDQVGQLELLRWVSHNSSSSNHLQCSCRHKNAGFIPTCWALLTL